MQYHEDFIAGLLKHLNLFSDLEAPALLKLSSHFKERVFKVGDTIFDEDSIGNSMMIITSGEVRVSQKSDPGNEEALIVLKKGDLFGEMGLLEDLPRSATVIAHSNVVMLEIARVDFLAFLEKESEAGVKILLRLSKILSSRLRETDTKLKTFISLTKWL
ncbi:MAG: cyclic nucleotide-binding domain-containing protein [Acidobacteriota bacterium]